MQILFIGPLQVQYHVKFTAFIDLTVHFNGSFHGVNNIFGNGHSQAASLRLMYPLIILADK